MSQQALLGVSRWFLNFKVFLGASGKAPARGQGDGVHSARGANGLLRTIHFRQHILSRFAMRAGPCRKPS